MSETTQTATTDSAPVQTVTDETMMQQYLEGLVEPAGTIQFTVKNGITISKRLNPIVMFGANFKPVAGKIPATLEVHFGLSGITGRGSAAPFLGARLFSPLFPLAAGDYTLMAKGTNTDGTDLIVTQTVHIVD